MADASTAAHGAGVTVTGGRPYNEDSFLADAPVFIVADGMGGHVGGAAASRAVVEAFRPLAGAPQVAPADVVHAVHEARMGVAEVSAQVGGDSGSTLTGAVVVHHHGEPWWMVINVGDSRVYAVEGGVAVQLTVDHSVVQELVAMGSITEEQARIHPDRNIITRAIGDEIPGQDAWLVPMSPGRRLVVCSDGLTKELEDAQIAALATAGNTAQAASALVDAALEGGAGDNVTVVVADSDAVTAPDASAHPWPVQGAEDQEDDTTPGSRRLGS